MMEHHELHTIVKWLEVVYNQNERIIHRLEKLMDDTSKLDAAVAKLQTDVDTLIAKPPASVQPAIDAATAAVEAVDAKVVAAIG